MILFKLIKYINKYINDKNNISYNNK
jgi:hypothetical protein